MDTNATIRSQTTPETIFDDTTPRRHAVVPQKQGVGGASLWLMVIGIALLAGAGGFVGGLAVGKSSTTSGTVASQLGAPGANGQQGMMGAMGTVTAVSSDSITVKDQMQNAEKTYSITSSTTVTDNGSASSVSAIKVGDTVFVKTGTSSTSTTSSSSSTSSSVASTIEINPTAPGGPSGTTTTSSSSSSSSN